MHNINLIYLQATNSYIYFLHSLGWATLQVN